ncbi:hypothetical protein BH11PAT2_BH11PAT2_00360 [soil metagenome]
MQELVPVVIIAIIGFLIGTSIVFSLPYIERLIERKEALDRAKNHPREKDGI